MVEVSAHRVAKDTKVSLQVSLGARGHELISDAQVPDGGSDAGPTPHEILAGSLAACTSITVQMYANRKGWSLRSCDVTVRMPESPIEQPEQKQTIFDLTISFDGDLSAEQRARLLEIANRCPVHLALKRPIQIHAIGV